MIPPIAPINGAVTTTSTTRVFPERSAWSAVSPTAPAGGSQKNNRGTAR
jgi:hypothetical protein